MATLIILGLHPTERTSGADFTSALTGLTVKVYDLSFGDSLTGTLLGQASGVFAEPNVGDVTLTMTGGVPDTTILQHYLDRFPPLPASPERAWLAAATAVVVAEAPAGHPEYPGPESWDLRIELERGGQVLSHGPLEFNVATVTMAPLSSDVTDYLALDPAVYVAVPRLSTGAGAGTLLSDDGTPPPFDDLVAAVDGVLALDPADGQTLAQRPQLSISEATQVAGELVWDRALVPPPAPPRPLWQMYTDPLTPPEPGVDADDAENDRRTFEAELEADQARRQAQVMRLATFVYSASAAVLCERLSKGEDVAGPLGPVPGARQALLTFPLVTGAADATTLTRASVRLLGSPAGSPLVPSFVVPAAHFYVLAAALPPQVDAGQRFAMALTDSETKTSVSLESGVQAGVVDPTEAPLTVPGPPSAVGVAQAARRLRAIGRVDPAAPDVPLTGPVAGLVGDSLTHTGPTATIDADFWVPETTTAAAAYLDLLLHVVTDNHDPLIAAVKAAPVSVGSVPDLVAVTDDQWRALFLATTYPPAGAPLPGGPPRLDLLPPFTLVGPSSTPEDQTEAFIRNLRMFFSVPYVTPTADAPTVDAPAAYPALPGDVLAAFAAAYSSATGGTAYVAGGPVDTAARETAIAAAVPGDADAAARLAQMLDVLDTLATLTTFGGDLQFSLMEALFARGFHTLDAVRALSSAAFRQALAGSVAYDHSVQIQAAAGGSGADPDGPPGPFRPVNPGGLTDCVPPEHLSPLGPVAYLHQLLHLAPSSTCEDPFPGGKDSLGVQLAQRRGPLGDLLASAPNLRTPVPAADLVLESLEALAAGSAGGAVFATSEAAGEVLATGPDGALTCVVATPEHSAPGVDDVPPAATSAYAALAADVSAPGLPYDQAVDTVRAYLEQAGGTSRYAAMRAFRRDVSSFVLDADPAHAPAGVEPHRRRYPVTRDLALEYLCLTAAEADLLTAHPVGGDEPWRLFGLPAESDQGGRWTDRATRVDVLLERTGLEWCDLVDLQRSGLVPFVVTRDTGQETLLVTHVDDLAAADRAAGDGEGDGEVPPRQRGLPPCPPCCLEDLVVRFPGGSEEGHGDRGDDGEVDVERPHDGEERPREDGEERPCEEVPAEGPDRSAEGLVTIALVARLTRRWRDRCGGGLGARTLADVQSVLRLDAPDLLEQLAAFLMLHDELRLEVLERDCGCLPEDAGPTDRVPLLGLFSGPGGDGWADALAVFVDAVGDTAEREEARLRVTPELAKVLVENLDALSALAGFDPAAPDDTWFARPTHALRFAEVLLKVYRSPFTVGELTLLFANYHITGDDPLPLQDEAEAVQDPLALGDTEPLDGGGPHSLWTLRAAVLAADPDEEDVASWTWARVTAFLRDDLGYLPPASGDDPWTLVGRRFFGDAVGASAAARRFEVPLAVADTSPGMWAGGPPDGPFTYDADAEVLTATLPLRDADVLDRLLQLRPLNAVERTAVRDLYFAPRAALAPFLALFDNPVATVERLVHADDDERFALLQPEVARTHARCVALAEHLAAHVLAVTESTTLDGHHGHHGLHDHHDHDHHHGDHNERHGCGCGEDERPEPELTAPVAEAWAVLRSLWADENLARASWEDDSGAPPEVTWTPKPSGGAFAALLGLAGTGLLGEVGAPGDCDDDDGPDPVLWRELRGPLSAFGPARDTRNAPFPTVVPALDLELTPEQAGYVALRNGMMLLDSTGAPVGGGQPFAVRWTGMLLVEESGAYRFEAGDAQAHENGDDEHCGCGGRAWRLTLRRGQRSWIVLNHGLAGEPAPDHRSGGLRLRRGAYAVTVDLEQREPHPDRPGEVCPVHTGFHLGYEGPDTGSEWATLPFDRLFLPTKAAGLGLGLTGRKDQRDLGEGAAAWLDGVYVSTLRDIRRTYQRAFKGVLLAHRFGLSATEVRAYRTSELGYLLAHAERFGGTAFPRTGAASFGTHRAWLALDLLPVADPYPPGALTALPLPPYPTTPDERSDPSAQRRSALFDVWERLWDYWDLRRSTSAARSAPAWLIFAENDEQQPDDPVQLLRQLGVPYEVALAVGHYDVPPPGPSPYEPTATDLGDERWAGRAWRAAQWLLGLAEVLAPGPVGAIRPDLWVAQSPGTPVGAPPLTGTGDLVRFVRRAWLDRGTPARALDLQRLDDCLRERARVALLAHLTRMDRVALPWAAGTFATEPADLSALLLQDLTGPTRRRVTRVEDAVSAVQAFVQRSLLGEEPGFVVTAAFAELWRTRFETFRTWLPCARREVYRENWVEYDEVRAARRSEAFALLEQRLREDVLTVPVPGGQAWWPGSRPPEHPCLDLLQETEWAPMALLDPVSEGLGLHGSPERSGAPAWLAPRGGPGGREVPTDEQPTDRPDDEPHGTVVLAETPAETPAEAPEGTPRRRRRAEAAKLATRSRHRTTTAVVEGEGGATRTGRSRRSRRAEEAEAGAGTHDGPTEGELVVTDGTVTDGTVTGTTDGATAAARVVGRGEVGEDLPLWLDAAIDLGTPFVRVAAAGPPPGRSLFAHHGEDCCTACGGAHEVPVDEYWFWLGGAPQYRAEDAVQDADSGVTVSTADTLTDQTSDWHRPERLPALLEWRPGTQVHLYWCRMHDGRFLTPRRSTEGVTVGDGPLPHLRFAGRAGDSLRFEVPGALPPVGHADPTPPGFRYDLPADAAVTLPLVVAPTAPTPPDYPGGLGAYPFFAHADPGAPLVPPSRFAVATTVAGVLRAHCHPEAALAWYAVAHPVLGADNAWADCGRDDGHGNGTEGNGNDGGDVVRVAATRRGGDVACCSSGPVVDAEARRRAVLLAVLETLAEAAERHLCSGGLEAVGQARVVVDAMGRVLGPVPRRVVAADDDEPEPLASWQPRPAPLNPRLLDASTRRADLAEQVRRTTDGRRLRPGARTLAPDEPAGAGFWADDPREVGPVTCDEICTGCPSCCSGPYRFGVVVQKALELAGETRGLGSALLAAYEKGTAEELSALRGRHERQVLELGVRSRQLQYRAADMDVQALGKTKLGAQARLAYFSRLLRNGNNAGEIGYEAATTVSLASRTASTVLEGIAQGMGMVPDMWLGVAGVMGTPLQFNQLPLGNKLAAGFSTAARITNVLADMANTTGGFSLTEGGWQRRTEEWQHQVELVTIEIQQIERQILAAERRRDGALRELDTHALQAEHAAQVQDFQRDSLTGVALWLPLQRETAALHRELYDLAYATARRAVRAYGFERGSAAPVALPTPPTSLREALSAGDALHGALRRLEGAYLEQNCREYELTKHVSLRADFPLAFLQLQQTGLAEVELPEWLFDVDYPGHYMRRLKSVSLTIPCVVGPYTGVHCRLTLLSSHTRVDPRLALPAETCCPDEGCKPGGCGCGCGGSGGCGGGCDCGTCRCPGGGRVRDCPCSTGSCRTCPVPEPDLAARYLAGPADPRVVRSYTATEAIATSSGRNDSGLFELGFRDERYLPFEYRGAVSRWRLELPPENNRFDPASLADVVMHLGYTAREGGDALRDAARQASADALPGAGARLFDVRADFPDDWYRLRSGSPCEPAGWPLRLGRDDFPYVPGGCDLVVERLEVFVEVGDPGCVGELPLRLLAGHERHHGPGEECRCAGVEVACVAGADLPCLFHGTVEVCLPLRGNRDRPLAELRLPPLPRGLTGLYLLAGYRSRAAGRAGAAHGGQARPTSRSAQNEKG